MSPSANAVNSGLLRYDADVKSISYNKAFLLVIKYSILAVLNIAGYQMLSW